MFGLADVERCVLVVLEDRKLLEKIKELSGIDLSVCMQCGICSGSCPAVDQMDITPRMMVRLIQLGREKEVLDSKAMWICLSCFTCYARCPREIDFAKLGEALRQVRLRKGLDYIRISEIPEEEFKKLPQIALVSCFRKFTS
ncbi:MAG: heterodisulfide reductase [Candidatus Hecatellales archaeon]|nr:MAG: heterodisulfide reductase [Candidatus Hecatellales archaeon]